MVCARRKVPIPNLAKQLFFGERDLVFGLDVVVFFAVFHSTNEILCLGSGQCNVQFKIFQISGIDFHLNVKHNGSKRNGKRQTVVQ